ncbi:hypothetical protein ARMGADRAFT_1022663 [Armillaria gallica]|uniref:Uncharacterized protein n=1 Tax=Armillaria gallica TaxID=47427 RepID=A0A2H3E9S9_ARMGA|nr:hypothetical protein ARMGADRAFT_1022663 [Armillaria gallica]
MPDSFEDGQYDDTYLQQYLAQPSKIQRFLVVKKRLKDIHNGWEGFYIGRQRKTADAVTVSRTDELVRHESVLSALAWCPLIGPRISTELQWHDHRMWDFKMVILSPRFSHPSNGRENFHRGRRGVPTSPPVAQPLNLSDAGFGAGHSSHVTIPTITTTNCGERVRDVFDIQVGTAMLSELAVYQDSDMFADLMDGQSLFQFIMFWLGGDIEGWLTHRIRPSETFPRGIDGRFITKLHVHFEDTTHRGISYRGNISIKINGEIPITVGTGLSGG